MLFNGYEVVEKKHECTKINLWVQNIICFLQNIVLNIRKIVILCIYEYTKVNVCTQR